MRKKFRRLRARLALVVSAVVILGSTGVNGIAAAEPTALARGAFDGTLSADAPEGSTIGWSTALSADGRRAVMGAPTVNGLNGAVYVYDRTHTGWAQPTVLNVPGTRYQELGFSVAISDDGRTIVTGAPFQQGGRAYVFALTRTDGWQLSATLTVPGLTVDDFGGSVSISGDGTTIAIADQFDEARRGSVFVSAKADGGWSDPTQIVGTDSAPNDLFGSAISLSADGSRLAVGAKGRSKYNGAVYTFDRDGGAWSQTAELTRADGVPAERFGNGVALAGDGRVLIASAPYHGNGLAYAYRLRGDGWTTGETLQPTQKSDYPSDAVSVAASYDGSVLMVGLPARNTLQGAAQVFEQSGARYSPKAMLVPSEYAGWMVLAGAGKSVALSADGRTAMLGAPTVSYNYPAGAGYVYDLARPSGFLAPVGTRSPSRAADSPHEPGARGPLDLSDTRHLTRSATAGQDHPILDRSRQAASVCGDMVADGTACGVKIATDQSLQPLVTADYQDGLSATQLQTAYGLTGPSKATTVAVVDAYANPDAVASLNTYRSRFGLGPADITQVNQDGGSTLPEANANWGVEEMLDLEMVSAACPDCKILYVGADSASFDDLGTAVNTAVRLGAKVVSNSYGGDESADALHAQDAYYTHPGVAITVSSGDGGYGISYPAAFNTVVAVGGTSLTLNPDGTRASETSWEGAGSGCSRFVAKPRWQKDSACANRTVADVSAVADPATGVAVYDSYGLQGWSVVGGTSVAAPVIAGVYGRTGHTGGNPAQRLYSAPKGSLYDVTAGSNGTCSALYLCEGAKGYDGATGLGSPNGVGAF
ncbi:hypothetical protein GCM10022403_086680 [Streptomyces coacervatus]|uniref:Peptidase S53 domain-containing protein n=1 Tax=Streptomyces coacervatus TaxID=647381 RepID=A0ABP7JD91_9ACTN|nr:S53 family peptidase [Streptomyces coacervatus]MDF2264281.1 S53 family peptidase [Streptomyces coacervatus]